MNLPDRDNRILAALFDRPTHWHTPADLRRTVEWEPQALTRLHRMGLVERKHRRQDERQSYRYRLSAEGWRYMDYAKEEKS